MYDVDKLLELLMKFMADARVWTIMALVGSITGNLGEMGVELVKA